MTTDTNIETLPSVDIDDEEDLSALDRGDALPEDEQDDDAEAQRTRDEQGRFKKADAKKAEAAEEEEEEPEEEPEEEEEGEEGEDAKGKGSKNEVIRLNKMREQRDAARAAQAALEARLAEVEKTKAPAKDAAPDPIEALNTEIDDLYEKVEEARADNDIKLAAQLQRQLDSKNREVLRIEAERIASKTTSQATENVRYDAMLEQYEAAYSILDPKSDDFDPKAVQALEYYVGLHEKGGMTPTKALRQTVQLLFGAPPAKQEAKGDDKKPEDKKPPVKKSDAKKAADTQKRQPPDAADRGNNNDDTSIKVSGLSEEDFEKLPETKKAQLRGDFG
jgi:hypothetical protein